MLSFFKKNAMTKKFCPHTPLLTKQWQYDYNDDDDNNDDDDDDDGSYLANGQVIIFQ